MERYTKRLEDGQAVMDCANCSESWNTNPDGKCTALYCRNRLKDRLAAYEDTGLEPCDYSAMAHALKQAERAREDLTEMIRQIGATGLDRLRELAQADREGRCVVLGQQNETLATIRELYKLLFDAETGIKNKDFSLFRHVGAGIPEITIPFLSRLHWIEDRYDEVIYAACKDEEAQAALRREQDG